MREQQQKECIQAILNRQEKRLLKRYAWRDP